jgi:hypothetical protein
VVREKGTVHSVVEDGLIYTNISAEGCGKDNRIEGRDIRRGGERRGQRASES